MRLWPFSGRKQASEIQHPGGAQNIFLRNLDLPDHSGGYDYARRVGTGVDASVVMAPIQWIQRSFPEAPLVMRQKVGEKWEVKAHPLAQLLDKPNPHYTGLNLWQATIFSLCTDGNAYWIVLKNAQGLPVQLWYAPHWTIKPTFPADGSEFLTGYKYTVSGKEVLLEIDDVVHFRLGIDPSNLRLGLSPLNSALREIWTDIEASEFIATLLRNSGVPGVLISPDMKDMPTSMTPEDRKEAKDYFRSRTTGSHRGEPMIMSGRTRLERISWNPEEMNLSPATDRSEERVCALLGVPAAVVGFSAGLEQTKVGATMTELRRLAWQNGIIPLHRNLEDEVERTLLPPYRDSGEWQAHFDTSEVAALQEDRTELFGRINRAVQGGWLTIAAGKLELGFTPEVGDDVYLRRTGTEVIPVGWQAPPPDETSEGEKGFKGAKEVNSPLEDLVVARDFQMDATAEQLRFMEIQEGKAPALAAKMADELVVFFRTLGEQAAAAATRVLEGEFPKALKQGVDSVLADRIVSAMAMDITKDLYEQLYERHYLDVATTSTAEAMGAVGLATDVADPAARAIVGTGGTRAGLVDLAEQAKASIFQAIGEGRSLGEGVAQVATRIGSLVPAGPWSTPEIRATLIARTETKHAQRMSSLFMARDQDVTSFRVFDARAGATDATCLSLDGAVVTASEADTLAADEHPNGTRDFVPIFGDAVDARGFRLETESEPGQGA